MFYKLSRFGTENIWQGSAETISERGFFPPPAHSEPAKYAVGRGEEHREGVALYVFPPTSLSPMYYLPQEAVS